MVRLSYFGAFSGWTPDGAQLRFETSKSAQVLARTAASRGRRTTRDELCRSLWPDSDEERARGSLRSALSALRRTLAGQRVFESDAGEVWILPGEVDSDLDGAEDLLSRCLQAQGYGLTDLLARFVALVDGEFCASWDNDWANQARVYWQGRWTSAAERLAGRLTQEEDWAGGLALCQRLLAADPFSESAAGTGIQCCLKLGRRSAALQMFEETVSAFRAELGCDPSANFLKLGEAIRQGSGEAFAVASVEASGPKVGRDAFQLVEDTLRADPDGALALMRSTGLRPSSHADPPATLELLEKVLAATSGWSQDRLQVVYCAAVFAGALNLQGRSYELCELMLEHADGDKLTMSRALLFMGFVAFERREWEEARALTERAQALATEIGHEPMIAGSDANLASFAWHQLRLDEARGSYERLIMRFADGTYIGEMQGAITKANLGHLEIVAGNWEAALSVLEAAHSWGLANMDRKVIVYSSSALGYVLVRLGRLEKAVAYLQGGLLASHEGHFLRFRDIALEHIGMSLVALGRAEGVWIMDAAERLRAESGHSRSLAEEKSVFDALAMMPDAEIRAARATGFDHGLPVGELVERAHRLADVIGRS